MRKLVCGIMAVATLLAGPLAFAQTPASVSQPQSITVVVIPIAQSIGPASATVTTNGPDNAGALIGQIGVVTNPPGGSTAGISITLSSPLNPDGTPMFVLNCTGTTGATGTSLPCTENVGAENIPATATGVSYAPVLTASP